MMRTQPIIIKPQNKQRGFTMITTLIMLVLLTLFVVSAINWSTINMRIISNMQAFNEARAAAEIAINQVTSAPINPAVGTQTIPVDINNDGTNDYSVAIANPVCVGFVLSPNTEAGVKVWDPTWDIRATVTSLSIFGRDVNLTMNQGVKVTAGGKDDC